MKSFRILLAAAAIVLCQAQSAEDPANEVKLSVSDTITFSVEEDPQKSTGPVDITVSPLSELTLPVSQCCSTAITLSVRDKTLAEVRKEVHKLLTERYYRQATVHLNLKNVTTRNGKVFFSGQVKNTTLPISPGETRHLYDALVEVGLTEFANIKKVKLQRTDPKTKQNIVKYYDMKKVKDGAKDSEDPVLKDGDRIEVAERHVILFGQ